MEARQRRLPTIGSPALEVTAPCLVGLHPGRSSSCKATAPRSHACGQPSLGLATDACGFREPQASDCHSCPGRFGLRRSLASTGHRRTGGCMRVCGRAGGLVGCHLKISYNLTTSNVSVVDKATQLKVETQVYRRENDSLTNILPPGMGCSNPAKSCKC